MDVLQRHRGRSLRLFKLAGMLLPVDPDASARTIRAALTQRLGLRRRLLTGLIACFLQHRQAALQHFGATGLPAGPHAILCGEALMKAPDPVALIAGFRSAKT